MKHIRRMIALLMCLLLMPVMAVAESQKLPLQAAHRVTYAMYSREQARTTAYWWQVKTAQDSVSSIRAISNASILFIVISSPFPYYNKLSTHMQEKTACSCKPFNLQIIAVSLIFMRKTRLSFSHARRHSCMRERNASKNSITEE